MKPNQSETKILNTVRNKCRIKHHSRILIALSGGADSAAMLYAFARLSAELEAEIYACHVNHMIRGAAADKDEEKSRKMCEELSIKFFSKKIDVPLISKNEHISEETAGRKARYAYFDEIMKKNNIDYLATAHHSDDRVETVVMNIIRGSGAKGFVGIDYKNGNIIRPMLDLTKREILSYCKENNIDYCNDLTNFEEIYTRNKIRRKVIPLFEEINPSVSKSILRMSDVISSEDEYMNFEAEKELGKCLSNKGVDVQYLNSLHKSIKRRVIFKYYASVKGSPNDISFDDVSSIISLCDGETGKQISLGGKLVASISYGYIKIEKENDLGEFEYMLEIDKPCVIEETGKCFTLKKCTDNSGFIFDDNQKIIIRNRRNGDFFYPCGMSGRKKLKDLFIDKKIDKNKRNSIPILTVNGEIASVVGIRNDRRFWSENGSYELVITEIREGIV